MLPERYKEIAELSNCESVSPLVRDLAGSILDILDTIYGCADPTGKKPYGLDPDKEFDGCMTLDGVVSVLDCYNFVPILHVVTDLRCNDNG